MQKHIHLEREDDLCVGNDGELLLDSEFGRMVGTLSCSGRVERAGAAMLPLLSTESSLGGVHIIPLSDFVSDFGGTL